MKVLRLKQRKNCKMATKQAIQWTILWILSACIFGLGINHYSGAEKASEFMNVYMVEKLLSFDNLFVFLLIFNHFNVPDKDRRKVLNYGLAGVVILRALFIGAGVAVVQQFSWVLYGLGAVLIYSAWGIAFAGAGTGDDDIEESRIIKFAKSLSIPPLFVWIIAIELSDIAFAIDSIPASLSISQDMFIVFSANIFAILGLRSFYFIIQSMYGILPQLKYGVGLILAFIGTKMFLPFFDINIDAPASLLCVVCILMVNFLCIAIKRIY